jgi:hypothetical protein
MSMAPEPPALHCNWSSENGILVVLEGVVCVAKTSSEFAAALLADSKRIRQMRADQPGSGIAQE